MTQPLPITVIGGFLGAGKTTLLNRLLAAETGSRIAVLVNDFGAINIDEQLVSGRDAEVMTLTNGCVCCSLQSDLVGQVGDLARRRDPTFDHLVIETSGVSDPGPIVRALGYPQLRDWIRLSSVATVVDPTQFHQLTGPARGLAEAQLLAADVALISKTDVAAPAQVEQLRAECRALRVRCLATADVPALETALLDASDGDDGRAWTYTAPKPSAESAFEHWSFGDPGAFRLKRLRSVLASLPDTVYRAKGFVCLDEVPGTECVVQVVGDRVDIRRFDRRGHEPQNRLVFIGLRGQVDWPDLAVHLRDCLSAECSV